MSERILNKPNNQAGPARPSAAELTNVPELDKTVLDNWRVQVKLKVANRKEQNDLAQKMRGLQRHEIATNDKKYVSSEPMINLLAFDPRERGYRISVGFIAVPSMTMHEALTHCLDATAGLCGVSVDQIPLASASMLSETDASWQKQRLASEGRNHTEGLPWQDVTINAFAITVASPEST